MESEKRPGGQIDTGRGTAPRKAVFLDRDGTMNTEVNYLHNPGDLELIPGTAEAVKLLNEAGFAVIVVTNQAGVARGYYTEADVEALHNYMNNLLKESGAAVDAFYYCPHHPEHGIGRYKMTCRTAGVRTAAMTIMLPIFLRRPALSLRASVSVNSNKYGTGGSKRCSLETEYLQQY